MLDSLKNSSVNLHATGSGEADTCGTKEMNGSRRRERQSAAAKARWADPEKREKISAALANPASRRKKSTAAKQQWGDPEQRKELQIKIKASRADPIVRQKIGAATKARWADPEMRERIIAAQRASRKKAE